MKPGASILFLLLFLNPLSLWAQDTARIQLGMPVAELLKLRGQPFYQTENYKESNGEQVWLYTRKKTHETVLENRVRDPQTQWMMQHKVTTVRTCEVGDVFVDVSQGVVRAVKPANDNVAYGPCVIDTKDEMLPLPNGNP